MELDVNPRVLVWAREEAGHDLATAAEELGIPEDLLAGLEDGSEKPNLGLMRRMSSKYGRSLAALAMPEPSPPLPRPEDFRTVGGVSPALSPKTLRAIRRVSLRQEAAAILLEELPELLPSNAIFRSTLATEPPVIAAQLRDTLGVSVDDQLSWGTSTEAFRTWRWRVEELGILVFVESVPRVDCRGFSLWPVEELPPIIFVNSQEAEVARMFTLFHELAHLSLGRAGICLEYVERIDGANVERFCNLVAASLLMPTLAVHKVVELEHGAVEQQPWSSDQLDRMARQLKVSGLAFALRLQELGLAPADYYEQISEERKGETWRGKGFGRSEHHERELSRLGSSFSSLVLGAHGRRMLTSIDAYRMLNTAARYFPDMRALLMQRNDLHGR